MSQIVISDEAMMVGALIFILSAIFLSGLRALTDFLTSKFRKPVCPHHDDCIRRIEQNEKEIKTNRTRLVDKDEFKSLRSELSSSLQKIDILHQEMVSWKEVIVDRLHSMELDVRTIAEHYTQTRRSGDRDERGREMRGSNIDQPLS